MRRSTICLLAILTLVPAAGAAEYTVAGQSVRLSLPAGWAEASAAGRPSVVFEAPPSADAFPTRLTLRVRSGPPADVTPGELKEGIAISNAKVTQSPAKATYGELVETTVGGAFAYVQIATATDAQGRPVRMKQWYVGLGRQVVTFLCVAPEAAFAAREKEADALVASVTFGDAAATQATTRPTR